jgi:23S rRNA maturation mini-RNase III
MSCTQIKNSNVDPVHAMRAYRDSTGITPLIGYLNSSPRPLYSRDRFKALIK